MNYELFCSNKDSPREHPQIKMAVIESTNEYTDKYVLGRIVDLLTMHDLSNRVWEVRQVNKEDGAQCTACGRDLTCPNRCHDTNSPHGITLM